MPICFVRSPVSVFKALGWLEATQALGLAVTVSARADKHHDRERASSAQCHSCVPSLCKDHITTAALSAAPNVMFQKLKIKLYSCAEQESPSEVPHT